VAIDGGGNFVVVWQSYFQNPGGWNTFAQAYDAAGAPMGGEFQVNSYARDYFGEYEFKPVVAADADGTFVVVWQDYAQDGDDESGYGAFGRRLTRIDSVVDAGLVGKKLVIVDKQAFADKAKVVYVAKDPGIDKGAGNDPGDLDGDFTVFYTDQPSSVVGTFVLPTPWRTNKSNIAKYVNSGAPDGVGDVKVGVEKTGVVAKVVAKGLGDGSSIDVFGGPPSASGGLTAVLTLRNAGDNTVRRFCTRFAEDDGSTVVYKDLAGGLGRKIVAKNGVPAGCS
jgi:hypothetical protein